MNATVQIEVVVKSCEPVAGSTFQTYDPELSTMSRDDLKVLCNRANGCDPKNPLVVAIKAEWSGRFQHWAKEETKKQVAVINADTDFRMAVIEELVSSGIARHVAANLTNTEAKMLTKAKEIGYI